MGMVLKFRVMPQLKGKGKAMSSGKSSVSLKQFGELVKVFISALMSIIDEMTPEVAQGWIDNRESLVRALREALLPPLLSVMLKASKVEAYLCRLFSFKLGSTDGKDTYVTALKVFEAGLDPSFETCGIVFSGVVPETELVADELIHNATFSKFLGNTAYELEKRRIVGSQFLAVCQKHPDRLCAEISANFFVLTRGDEAVAEDLSNVFVARVDVHHGGELNASLLYTSDGNLWNRAYGHRLFSPQRTPTSSKAT